MQTIHTLNVTDEQVSKCHRIVNEATGETFYKVENSNGKLDENGDILEYTVRYDKAHRCLTCTCPSMNPPVDEHGYLRYAPRTCWHLRAVTAHVQSLREERKEQSEIERYVRQGVDRETSMRVVYSKPVQPSELEVKRAMQANQARPFSILR